MEDAAQYAEKIVLMKEGTVDQIGTPREIFQESERLSELGLLVPEVVRFQRDFEKKFSVSFSKVCLNMDELLEEMMRFLPEGRNPL